MKPKNRTETLWYTWSVLSLLMLICLWGGASCETRHFIPTNLFGFFRLLDSVKTNWLVSPYHFLVGMSEVSPQTCQLQTLHKASLMITNL